MKRIFNLLVVILLLSVIAEAQTSNNNDNNNQSIPVDGADKAKLSVKANVKTQPLPPYISKFTKPSYYSSWLPLNPTFWISKYKGAKGKKDQKAKSKGLPAYVTYSAEPYYSTNNYWQFSDRGILQDTFITAKQKRKTYGKDQFITLKRQYNEGKEKETLTKAISALRYSPLNADSQQEIELLNFLASFCIKNELFNEAESFYKSALARQLLEPEFFNYAKISLSLAGTLNKQRKYDESLKFASFALTEFTQAGNRDGIATCNLLIADNYYCRGDLLVAEKIILNKALGLFSYVGNQGGRMACFEKLGQIYIKLNRNSEAKWFFIQQNMLSKNEGNKIQQFNSLIDLGRAKIAIGDYKLALKDFREANAYLNTNSTVGSRLKLEEAYSHLFQKQGNKKLSKLSLQKCKKLRSALEKTQSAQKKAAYKLLNFSKEQKQIYFASAAASNP